MGKHVSTALPYFGKAPGSKLDISCAAVITLSPGKRNTLRSECIGSTGQVILVKGVINQSKYEELQEAILGDMSTL